MSHDPAEHLVRRLLRKSVAKGRAGVVALWRLFRRFFGATNKPEIYIGETSLFDSGQKTLERYGDFQEIGTWGVATQNDKGEWESEVRGKMLAETVKFVGKDGSVKLGRDWLTDNDKRVTVFDPTILG